MAARMQSGNFTGVVTNDAEVAGGRSDGWTSVAPLHKRDLGDGRPKKLQFRTHPECGQNT
jgi:hypothetical protein